MHYAQAQEKAEDELVLFQKGPINWNIEIVSKLVDDVLDSLLAPVWCFLDWFLVELYVKVQRPLVGRFHKREIVENKVEAGNTVSSVWIKVSDPREHLLVIL